MARISYIDATCIYQGATAPSVAELSLDVQDGEFMVLVGPSGSGKSTALRMLAGLEPVGSGEIHIDGSDVSHKPPKDRDIAMVFQNYALYPHMTVAENMGYALKLRGLPKREREAKVSAAAGLLDLQNHLDRRPKSLSGGQRQRVAMGRHSDCHAEGRGFESLQPLSEKPSKSGGFLLASWVVMVRIGNWASNDRSMRTPRASRFCPASRPSGRLHAEPPRLPKTQGRPS
jgi:hypothetical protein